MRRALGVCRLGSSVVRSDLPGANYASSVFPRANYVSPVELNRYYRAQEYYARYIVVLHAGIQAQFRTPLTCLCRTPVAVRPVCYPTAAVCLAGALNRLDRCMLMVDAGLLHASDHAHIISCYRMLHYWLSHY